MVVFNECTVMVEIFNNLFKKLIFEKSFEYVLKLQNLCLKYLKNEYEYLKNMENTQNDKKGVLEESKKVESDDSEKEEYDTDIGDTDVNSHINKVLRDLTHLDHYNQIDFYKDPERIIQMTKGFLMLGGHASINIGFERTISKTKNSTQEKEIRRLNLITNEFRKCTKSGGWYTFLYFLALSNEYNDVFFELLENDSPLIWTIDECRHVDLTLFEYAIEKSNIEIAMRMIEKCDISKVI